MSDDGAIDADMMLSVVPDGFEATAQKALDACGTLSKKNF